MNERVASEVERIRAMVSTDERTNVGWGHAIVLLEALAEAQALREAHERTIERLSERLDTAEREWIRYRDMLGDEVRRTDLTEAQARIEELEGKMPIGVQPGAIDALLARTKRFDAAVVIAIDALEKSEKWEARFIGTDAVWNTDDGLPAFTQELYDAYITDVQGSRNKAMRALREELSPSRKVAADA